MKDNVIYLKDYLAVWLKSHYKHPLWNHAYKLYRRCEQYYFVDLNKPKRTIKTNKRLLNEVRMFTPKGV